MDSKSQRNGVQNELKRLREKQLAKSQRDKLKDLSCTPLTTPEEAQAFLATMRDAQHKRDGITHQPPSNLSADGMDAWFLRKRQEELALRERKKEAEAILRNYRSGNGPNSNVASPRSSTGGSTALDDPNDMGAGWGGGSDVGGGGGPSPSVASAASRALQLMKEEEEEQQRQQHHHHSHEANTLDEKKESHEDVVRSERGSRSSTSPKYATSQAHFFRDGTHPHNHHTASSISTTPTSAASRSVGRGIAGQPFSKSLDRGSSQRRLENGSGHGKDHASSNYNNVEPETVWRDFVSSEPGATFPPAAGRYHLYCSYACPGSHRALIVRALKGLEHVISVTCLHPVWRLTNPNDPDDKHRGWVFGNPGGDPFANTIHKGGPFPAAYEGNEPDPHLNAFSIRDVYEAAHDTSGKYTIPLLWDTQLQTIVNNESSDIAYMFNSCFNDFCTKPELDLYTEDDAAEKAKLSQVSEWLNPLMIHGVYRCGFAKTQWAYDRAINDLCAAFDRADDTLEEHRFLTGNALTDVDIRLFVTLLRFDEVYTIYFKANARLVMLTPSLLNFCRDVYQLPGVAETCNMEQIKAHFFASHAEWNKYSVIPRGLGFMELLEMDHDRDRLAPSQEAGMPQLMAAQHLLPPPPEEEEGEDEVQPGWNHHN